MRLYKSSYSVYRTQYHIVWVTKYRRKILVRGVDNYLKIKLKETSQYHPGNTSRLVSIKTISTSTWLVISLKYAVSRVVEAIKSNTSKALKTKFSFLKQVYWGTEKIWSPGYFVPTVGIEKQTIRRYVAMQGKEDAGQAPPAMF